MDHKYENKALNREAVYDGPLEWREGPAAAIKEGCYLAKRGLSPKEEDYSESFYDFVVEGWQHYPSIVRKIEEALETTSIQYLTSVLEEYRSLGDRIQDLEGEPELPIPEELRTKFEQCSSLVEAFFPHSANDLILWYTIRSGILQNTLTSASAEEVLAWLESTELHMQPCLSYALSSVDNVVCLSHLAKMLCGRHTLWPWIHLDKGERAFYMWRARSVCEVLKTFPYAEFVVRES